MSGTRLLSFAFESHITSRSRLNIFICWFWPTEVGVNTLIFGDLAEPVRCVQSKQVEERLISQRTASSWCSWLFTHEMDRCHCKNRPKAINAQRPRALPYQQFKIWRESLLSDRPVTALSKKFAVSRKIAAVKYLIWHLHVSVADHEVFLFYPCS